MIMVSVLNLRWEVCSQIEGKSTEFAGCFVSTVIIENNTVVAGFLPEMCHALSTYLCLNNALRWAKYLSREFHALQIVQGLFPLGPHLHDGWTLFRNQQSFTNALLLRGYLAALY